MQFVVSSHVPGCDPATYSITFVRVGGSRVCPFGGIAGSATQGAITGALTTNDFTHGSPSQDKPEAIGFVEVQPPLQSIGGSKDVTLGEDGA